MSPRPTLTKKGVAFLMGCTLATVKKLVDNHQLVGLAMNEAGDGWQRHPGTRGAIDLFFDLEDVLRVREERPKRTPTREREGRVEDLPRNLIIPTLSLDQAADRLGMKRVALWWRVRNEEVKAYVINDRGTGWTLYGEPDAAQGATVFFTPEDIILYASTIHRGNLEKRQRGKVGRPPKYAVPPKHITVDYPQDLIRSIDQRTSNRSEWLIQAAKEKLQRESYDGL